MPKEYRTISEVAGPLMLVKGVDGVAYNELGEIELKSGERRRCRVLEIDGTNVLVQLFESGAGINLAESKVHVGLKQTVDARLQITYAYVIFVHDFRKPVEKLVECEVLDGFRSWHYVLSYTVDDSLRYGVPDFIPCSASSFQIPLADKGIRNIHHGNDAQVGCVHHFCDIAYPDS